MSDDTTTKKGIRAFFKDYKSEFLRITWPTKENIKKAAIVSFIFIIIWNIITGAFDYGFSKLFNNLIYK